LHSFLYPPSSLLGLTTASWLRIAKASPQKWGLQRLSSVLSFFPEVRFAKSFFCTYFLC
jgi:hypothetical protein